MSSPARSAWACRGSRPDLGFFWSALFLMVVPVAVAGLIGGWLYYAYRRGRDGGATGARQSRL